jgi:hypothetical protein
LSIQASYERRSTLSLSRCVVRQTVASSLARRAIPQTGPRADEVRDQPERLTDEDGVPTRVLTVLARRRWCTSHPMPRARWSALSRGAAHQAVQDVATAPFQMFRTAS